MKAIFANLLAKTLDVLGTFKISGVQVTATAAELNALDGITASVDELNILDGVTASAAELNLIDGSIAGTAVASKALVLGANKEVDALVVADGGLALGAGAGTAVLATAAEINRAADVSTRLIAAGSTLAVTVAAHDGKTILLDTATGSVCTLPSATGSGARFKFAVSVLATSNSHIVKVTTTDIMQGVIFACSTGETPDLAQPWITAADSDTITLNRTTTGSVIRGEWIEVEDVAAGLWLVRGVVAQSGTEATPFSATVS